MQFEYLNGLKEHFNPLDADPEDVAHIRMQADLFDIMALLDKTDFDCDYFKEGLGFYSVLCKDKGRTKGVAGVIHKRLASC
jgi:hypothetical protein